MTLYNFIFSRKTKIQVLRHVSFWTLWLLVYGLAQTVRRIEFLSYNYADALKLSFIETAIQLPIDIAFTYFIIYYLLPQYLFKGKLSLFFIGWFLSILMTSIVEYYYTHLVVLPLRVSMGMAVPQQPGFFLSMIQNSISYNMEAGLATSIRLIKGVMYQKKKLNLFQNKLSQIKDEKNMITTRSPGNFLEPLIEHIEKIAQPNTNDFTRFLSGIKKLIKYVDTAQKKSLIYLKDEIDSFHQFLDLYSCLRPFSYSIEYKGIPGDKKVVPYLLIPLVDSYLQKELNSEEPAHTKTSIVYTIEGDLFQCDIEIYTPKSSPLTILEFNTQEQNLYHLNSIKELNIKYPDSFQLQKTINGKAILLSLSLQLNKVVQYA